MLPEPYAASEKRGFHFALGQTEAFGDFSYGVHIPVPANKNIPFLFVQFTEKSVDGFHQHYIINAALYVIGCGNALLHFSRTLTDKGASLQAAAVTAAIKRYMPGDSGKERI